MSSVAKLEPDPARVLIVDSDEYESQTLVAALDDLDAVCARDSGRALELAIEQSFDLVLANATLPGIAGMDLLTWLKSEPKTQDMPVILVAPEADRTDEGEAAGLRMGAVDFITQPIRPAILSARVHTHIELKRQRDLLREYLPHDALTGIANRRRFNQELLRTWARCTRAPRPVILMLLQLDHFDRFVEHYGRSPADECLIRTARALHRQFGDGEDLAARHGGDRFAIMVEDEDWESTANRVLATINDMEIPHARSECSAYVSASVGAVIVTAGSDTSPEDAMALTQLELQAAVADGRARCSVRRVGET